MPAELVKYDAARTALAAAHRVDEAKDLRDKALALAAYARQARDLDLVTWATEIKVRAERRTGELLRKTAETGQRDKGRGGDRKSASSCDDSDKPPNLKALGITRDQSSTWQKLAAIPGREFDRRIDAVIRAAEPMTTAKILRPSVQPKRSPATSPRPRAAANPLIQALEEGRQWMLRWRHLAALAAVFDVLNEALSVQKGSAR